jgi:hypothetical protein
MWGYANYRNREYGKSLFKYLKKISIGKKFNSNNENIKGKDQDFLLEYFWPIIKKKVLIHDSYFCKKLGGVPFPTQRPDNNCFVSCSYCCDKKYNKKWEFGMCPVECRPHKHKNWTYC